MQNIDDLLREADLIIEKKASKAAPVSTAISDDEVTKLAEALIKDEPALQTKIASKEQPIQETTFEKIAHAMAIVETLVNLEELQKLANFVEQAESKGFSEAQIEEYLEKNAALKPVHKYVTIPGAMLALGAGAGHAHGKKSGYNDAISDVTRAMSGQGEA